MASLTNPYEGPTNVIRDPSLGSISFSGKDGNFSVYFFAERDDQGNVTKEGFSAPIHFPRFLVVSVGFFRIVGGKPDRKDPLNFIAVYSPIFCWDKGYKWEQVIHVWLCADILTERYYGTWPQLKDKIELHGGRYAEVLFVVAPEYPDKLLRLELTGYSISQLKKALKPLRGPKITSLVNGPHVLEMAGTVPYEIAGRRFLKPVFKVKRFTSDSNGYDQFYPRLLDFSRRVDEYGDALAANQKISPPTNDGGRAAQQPRPPKPDDTFRNSQAGKIDTGGYKPPQVDESLLDEEGLPF